MSLMDAFNMGVQGGQVSSAAYGPGQAIRSVIENARKKGLIREQGMMSVLPAMMKARQDSAALPVGGPPSDAGFFTDPTTNKTGIRNYKYDKNTRRYEPQVRPASFNMMESLFGGDAAGGDVDLNTTIEQLLMNLKGQ